MKKLTKKQLKNLKDLVLNKDGTIKKSFNKNYFYLFMIGGELPLMRDNGFKKSPVLNLKTDIIFKIVEVLGLQIEYYNTSPRGGIMGNMARIKRASKIKYEDIVKAVRDE